MKVSPKQAVIGFRKFSTIGIGFAKEEDWNSNLPFGCKTEEIYNHIAHNRAGADPATCREAIRMIQQAVLDLKLLPQEKIDDLRNRGVMEFEGGLVESKVGG